MDGPSKASKKNKKRIAKKKESHEGYTSTEDMPMTPDNMLSELKKELAVAKANHDHQKSSELREQVWVLTDVCAGVKTDIPDAELKKIINNIPFFQKDPDEIAATETAGESGSTLSEPEKECRKIRKKLKQISELKGKLSRGEKIEVNQQEKLASESKLREELRELEDLLVTIRLR